MTSHAAWYPSGRGSSCLCIFLLSKTDPQLFIHLKSMEYQYLLMEARDEQINIKGLQNHKVSDGGEDTETGQELFRTQY